MIKDPETHFSSFFMLLLSATSLIVILSQFMAGGFNYRSKAYTAPVSETYLMDEYPDLEEDEMVFEEDYGVEIGYPAEDGVDEMIVEEEGVDEDANELQFRLETTVEPSATF